MGIFNPPPNWAIVPKLAKNHVWKRWRQVGGGLFKVPGQLGRLRWTLWTVVDNCKCGLWWTHFGHFCLDRRSSRQVWWGRLGILSIGNLQNDASEIYAEGSNQAGKFIYFPDLNRNIWDDESNCGAKLPNSQTEISEDCSKVDSANISSDLCCFIRLLKCICCDLFQIIRFCK